MNKEVEHILQEFDREGVLIAKGSIYTWMETNNLEAKGALYSKIVDHKYLKKIHPPLEFDDYFNFVVPYLLDCIKENPDGDWSESRYIAGHQLAAWVVDWWNDPSISRKYIARVKRELEKFYKDADAGAKDGLINGVLEHIFVNKKIATYFNDWLGDPILKDAYEASLL